MKKYKIIIFSLLSLLLMGSGCDGGNGENENNGSKDDSPKYKGLVINEVAGHSEDNGESWIEILNSTSSVLDLNGVSIKIVDSRFNDKVLYTAPSGKSLAAGERLVISTQSANDQLIAGVFSTYSFDLKLESPKGFVIDEFKNEGTFSSDFALTKVGSYQRIPDGSSTWRKLTYSSKGRSNEVFNVNNTLHNAAWLWSSYMPELMENDYAKLKELKQKGIDHLLLNYSAFETTVKIAQAHKFIEKADELGIAVHAWIQCFHTSEGWISPIDDEKKQYKEEIYNDILSRAKMYIEDFGVKGLHLDYIRFGGRAYTHNHSDEVNAVGAVNRCCKEISDLAHSYDEGLVTSAALMGENHASGIRYYGQDYDTMGQYLDILMPMIYKYSYGYTANGCRELGNQVASNKGGAECWAGTTTYQGDDSSVTPMDAEGILSDCSAYKGSNVKGIVLFRYGLGTFPDLTDFWK